MKPCSKPKMVRVSSSGIEEIGKYGSSWEGAKILYTPEELIEVANKMKAAGAEYIVFYAEATREDIDDPCTAELTVEGARNETQEEADKRYEAELRQAKLPKPTENRNLKKKQTKDPFRTFVYNWRPPPKPNTEENKN